MASDVLDISVREVKGRAIIRVNGPTIRLVERALRHGFAGHYQWRELRLPEICRFCEIIHTERERKRFRDRLWKQSSTTVVVGAGKLMKRRAFRGTRWEPIKTNGRLPPARPLTGAGNLFYTENLCAIHALSWEMKKAGTDDTITAVQAFIAKDRALRQKK